MTQSFCLFITDVCEPAAPEMKPHLHVGEIMTPQKFIANNQNDSVYSNQFGGDTTNLCVLFLAREAF